MLFILLWKFGSVHINRLKSKVDNLYSDDDATTEEIGAALKEFTEALKVEERFWKKKSRIFWLRVGDLNTMLFHAITKQRRASNKITDLLDSAGNLVEDEEKLVVIATEYFRELFTSSNPELIEEAPTNVTTTICDQINADLTVPLCDAPKKGTWTRWHDNPFLSKILRHR